MPVYTQEDLENEVTIEAVEPFELDPDFDYDNVEVVTLLLLCAQAHSLCGCSAAVGAQQDNECGHNHPNDIIRSQKATTACKFTSHWGAGCQARPK